MKTSTKSGLLEAVHLALLNLSDNRNLQQKLNVYGFNSKRIQEGNALLGRARLMDQTQQQHYTDTRQVSLRIEQDGEAALELFRDHVAIAKTAFRKEPLVLQELNIKKIQGKPWGWTQQAQVFYQKAVSYRDRLQSYGGMPESFEQNQAAVEALLALKAQRLKCKGEAEHGTHVRDQTLKELRAWYGEFRKLARLAFQHTPQILETFGIIVRSSPKKRSEVSES